MDSSRDIRRPGTSRPLARDPNRATPTTLPVCRAVFRLPAATPERVGSTLPSSAVVIVGATTPAPNPSSTNWATRAVNGVDRSALTPSGRDFLDEFGVDLPPRRRTVRYCVDWTEQRHHLAGGLGCGLLGRVRNLGWVRPTRGNRAVEITAAGRDGLSDTFGIDPD